MNILILAAANGVVETEGLEPISLTEIHGTTLIEYQINLCREFGGANYIVALSEKWIKQYHLDRVVKLIVPEANVVSVNSTSGAACTALLAADYIDNDDELLILNGNELVDIDYAQVVSDFKKMNYDAGVVTFQSIHPRYSYVRLDENELVVEAAEKTPISRNATVGFYWFAKGSDFVMAAKNMIRKNASVNGNFYICPSLNEMVLAHAKIGRVAIASEKYHPLKNERQISSFDRSVV